MELWIPITIAAAFLQNLRSALQKHLAGRLGTAGTTYVRFAFGAPFAVLYLSAILALEPGPPPVPGTEFVVHCVVGGITQILGTALLIRAFAYRNFTVGTALSKTEVVQTVIFGIVILGEPVGPTASLAILVCLAGVVLLSLARTAADPWQLVRQLGGPAALLGLGSGGGFGIAAVSYRAAALSLSHGSFVLRAALTLASVIVVQTVVMTVWMAWREPEQLAAVWRARGIAVWVGLSGMAASAGWFTAMTIQNAALVRALGQIELLFTFAASRWAFRERSTRAEIAGIALVVAGILILLLGRG